jgi:ABC-2 type transport system ATP-binding protein
VPVTPMIEVKALTKRFGATLALDEVSLSVEAGRVLALLGPNGAGKTTLVRVLTTLLQPDSGRAKVAGLDVRKDARAVRSIIGLAGQYAAVDALLTGRETWSWSGSSTTWTSRCTGVAPRRRWKRCRWPERATSS